jgi:hypothetical protein
MIGQMITILFLELVKLDPFALNQQQSFWYDIQSREPNDACQWQFVHI